MTPFQPTNDFPDRVMVEIYAMHQRKERQLLLLEKLINAFPVKALLSMAAMLGGIWNLVRIYMMLSPVLCK